MNIQTLPRGLGSPEWQARGGALSLGERWAMTLTGLRKQLALRQARRARHAHPTSPLDLLDASALDSLAPPSGPLVDLATQAASRLQPLWLNHHCWRTYAWGSLLALQAGLEFDRRLFFVACQLHDLGLTRHAAHPAHDCFTLRGARLARTLLEGAHASPDEIQRVEQAIVLHMNLEVGVDEGVEAHLLQAGAALDVVGQRQQELPAALQDAVLGRYPRLAFKEQMCRCMRIESLAAPQSRAGFFVRRLGFVALIEAAPFED